MARLKIFLLLLLSCGFLCCEKSGSGDMSKASREIKKVGLRLAVGDIGHVRQSRAESDEKRDGISVHYSPAQRAVSRSIADDEDYMLSDIVVLQFDSGGALIMSAYIDNMGDLTPEVYGSELIYIPEVTLVEDSNCSVFVIANTASPTLFSGVQTLNQALAMKRNISDESSVLVSGKIPMTGLYQGVVDDQSDIRIELVRMFARFDITVNVGTLSLGRTIDLTSIEVRSAATEAIYYDKYKGYNFTFNDVDPGFPPLPGENMSSWGEDIDLTLFTDYAPKALITGEKTTWYLPENIRGTGSNYRPGTTQKSKGPEFEPSTRYWSFWEKSGLKVFEKGIATRIWLSGKYTTPVDGEMNILITLYPGDDNLNDFNVRRNTLYDITVNINDVDPGMDADGNYLGSDYRVFIWKEGVSATQAYPPTFQMNVIQGMNPSASLAGGFYLDSVDSNQLEKAEIVVISGPSGRSYSAEMINLNSPDGMTFSGNASIWITERLYEDDLVSAYTKITMKDGRIFTSEYSYTYVRGSY